MSSFKMVCVELCKGGVFVIFYTNTPQGESRLSYCRTIRKPTQCSMYELCPNLYRRIGTFYIFCGVSVHISQEIETENLQQVIQVMTQTLVIC